MSSTRLSVFRCIFWGLIVGLVVIGMWLRFWHLDAVPSAFYHDEMDYVVTGQSILNWGTDLSGKWTPWQLHPLQTVNFTAEWPALFHAITQYLFGSSPGPARLTNALWGLATVLLIGLLTQRVAGNTSAGWWASGLMFVNHWHVHISRLGYEATISLFFQIAYILGLTHLLPFRDTDKKKHPILWVGITLLSLMVAYFTYHGAKFTVLIISVTYISWWLIHFRHQIKVGINRWRILDIVVVGMFLVLLITHSLWINSQGLFGARSKSDLYSIESTNSQVDIQRRDQVPVGLSLRITNKLSLAVREFTNRYAFVFDTTRLFVSGYEGSYQFSLLVAGYFGLAELLGFLLLFRNINHKSPYFRLFILLLVVSPIATIVAGYQALFRSALTYAIIILLSGWGISTMPRKKQHLTIGLMIFMIVTGVWFGMCYFSRYSLLTAENHMLSDRLLARYVRQTSQPITVVVDKDSYITARAIVYYNQMFPTLTQAERQQFAYPFPATFNIKNITVTTECPTILSESVLVVNHNKWENCGLNAEYQTFINKPLLTALSSPLDNGSYYFIWHNYLCGNEAVKFIHLRNLSELNVEAMTDQQFCQTWVKK